MHIQVTFSPITFLCGQVICLQLSYPFKVAKTYKDNDIRGEQMKTSHQSIIFCHIKYA